MITLSEKDYTMIDIWRKRNADDECARDLSNFMPSAQLLKVWSEAKEQHLYTLMGDNLILKRHIKIEKPIERITTEYEDARYKYGNPIKIFMDALEREWWNTIGNYTFITDILTPTNICHNKLVEIRSEYSKLCYNNKKVKLSEDVSITIQKGMKMMKLLSKLAEHFSLTEKFEAYRLEHSRLLNDKYIEGDFCLSIHPLDYMTMSDNTYNWSSCMSWGNKGCYRAGTVEMMNSPCVVVAYLDGVEEPFHITSNSDVYTWNNKKWRELFIVNKDIITGIKAYPYHNEALEKIACEWLKELADTNLDWTYTNRTPYYACPRWYLPAPSKEISKTAKFATNAMYNDFYNDFYNDITRYAYFNNEVDIPKINYSGIRQCMWCGDCTTREYAHEGQISCLVCSGYSEIFCCCCEEEYDKDDLILLENGVWVCRDCYEKNMVELLSGEKLLSYDVVFLRVVNEEPSDRYNERSSEDAVSYALIGFKRTDTLEDWAQHFTIPAPREDGHGYLYVFACECKDYVIQKTNAETKPF